MGHIEKIGKLNPAFFKVALLVICISILFSSCAEQPTAGSDRQSGFGVDIMQLQPEDKEMSEEQKAAREEQFYELFRQIYASESKDADKVIGCIAGKEIRARDFEIRALKMREGGSKSPYGDAWEALKQEAAEAQLIKEENLEKEFSKRLRQYSEELSEAVENDEQLKTYYKEQRIAFGMTKKAYRAFMQEANVRICRHFFVEEHLQEKELDPLDLEEIEAEVLDEVYERLIDQS